MTQSRPWDAVYPPGLAWDQAVPVTTLPALLGRAVAAHGGKTAISFRGRAIGFEELGARVERLARGLWAAGVRPGDAVALLLGNSPAHPVAFFAALRVGAVVVHLTPLDPARAVARKLEDSGATTLITTNLPGVLPQAVEAGPARLIVADDAAWGPSAATLPLPPGALDMLVLDGPEVAWPEASPDDPALLQYTGGTTGQPRAAVLSHANLTSAVAIYEAWGAGTGREIRPADRVLCVLPLFHIYALTAVLLRSLVNGVEMVLHERFALEDVMRAIEAGVTHMNGVPTMWIAMVNAPGVAQRDLTSLRVVSSGGAGLPYEVAQRFHALTGLHMGGGWGMTETSPAGTNLLPGRAAEPGEIGVPLPGVDVRVVALEDPTRALPPGRQASSRCGGLT